MPETLDTYHAHQDGELTQEVARRYTGSHVDEIIARPPGRLLTSGISMIAGCTVIALILSWMIRYPDIIDAPLTLTAAHAPVDLVMKSTGAIERLYFRDGDYVARGDTIALIANTANLSDIHSWRITLQTLWDAKSYHHLTSIAIREDLALGEMQGVYREISGQVTQVLHLLAINTTALRTQQMEQEIHSVEALNASQERQIALFDQELHLSGIDHSRSKQLFEDGVISTREFEQMEARMLQVRRQKEMMYAGLLQNAARIAQLRSSIVELEMLRETELTRAWQAIRESLKSASSTLALWTERYLVTAPVTGVLSMPDATRTDFYVQAGTALGTVIPGTTEGEAYAHVVLPAQRARKVQAGQRAIVRLDAWPHKEYGSVAAQVRHVAPISLSTRDGISAYEASLHLPVPLVTTYGISLPYEPRGSGTARIVTEERRVLHRIFDSLISIIKNH